MFRIIACAIVVIVAALGSGCQAVQGTVVQTEDTLHLPARLYGGVDRVPITPPTLSEIVDRTYGMPQLRAMVQGTERQFENATQGME